MKTKFSLVIIFMLSFLQVFADEPVKFSASAPSTVIMEKPFQLTFTVNATGKDFRAPSITNFEILAGPFESRSSSYQIINGNATSSVSVTYTFTLLPKNTGTFTIPSASISVNGQKYTSNGVSVKVLPADEQLPEEKSKKSTSSGQSISGNNIFIRSILSKSTVYEQEPVLLTYKIYTTYDIKQYSNKKMSDFKGFMKQEIEQDANKQLSYENYNGKNYMTAVLYEVLLYPQNTGDIVIDAANFEAILRVQNKSAIRSIFDDFFEYTDVAKNIVAPAARLKVKALPGQKPVGYTGLVGSLALQSSMSTNQVKVNDAVTLKISLNGKGNMKLIPNPAVEFPDDFETYDPKVTNNFKNATSGMSGSKTIEYTFIPRHAGNFEIPPVEISFFDLGTGAYKTLRTPVYQLQVLKGDGSDDAGGVVNNFVNKENVKQIAKDIRYIQTGEIVLKPAELPLFGSLTAWLLYLIPLVIAIALLGIFSKQARENANLALVRNKKANKVAQKRLKAAGKLLKAGNRDQFYEEVLKAVWTYLSDKLAIPVAELTKERVSVELGLKSVSDEKIKSVLEILNTCEFARYAPNGGQEAMGNLYDETIQVISEMEEIIKK